MSAIGCPRAVKLGAEARHAGRDAVMVKVTAAHPSAGLDEQGEGPPTKSPGASAAHLLKGSPPEELINGIRTIARGESVRTNDFCRSIGLGESS